MGKGFATPSSSLLRKKRQRLMWYTIKGIAESDLMPIAKMDPLPITKMDLIPAKLFTCKAFHKED